MNDVITDQLAIARHLLRWVLLGALVGVLAGLSSAVFLISLDWATVAFDRNGWLLFLLPIGGLAVGCVYHYLGGRSEEGNNLILAEIHEPSAWVPRRMAPMILVGTVVTHLFGGSAGREGTAIQMSGSLTDAASRILRLDEADRRTMLVVAIAGGFGSVFGVPIAGAVFGLEVQSVGRVRYDALVPCLMASVVGDLVVAGLGVEHDRAAPLPTVDLSAGLALKVALAGVVFGLVGIVFSRATHGVKDLMARTVRWKPGRPFLGGVAVIALTLAVGNRDYNGLSLGLIGESLGGGDVPTWAFALKLVFTAVTLGSGFVGGEVTPLFVIGATLGATLAVPLGVPVPVLAALGFVAVFAGAANTPLACTVMGVELFGAGAVPYFAIACVVAYVCSSHRGIYGTQRVAVPKWPSRRTGPGDDVSPVDPSDAGRPGGEPPPTD
ncbi:MAG: voltage-gated chloride channel family protein [Microthrixaceae bacterium]